MPGTLVLVTRPEPGCGATCRALAAAGHVALAAPLLAIEPAPHLAIGARPQAVLVTSASALACLEPLAGVALLAVGDATAACAATRGWADCRSAGGDASDLRALCRATLDPARGELLLLAGAGEGEVLARALRADGFTVRVATAYARRVVAAFPVPAADAIAAGEARAALFFSRSAASAFAALLPAPLRLRLAGIAALAISDAAAAPLRALPFGALRVASRPNSADLLALL